MLVIPINMPEETIIIVVIEKANFVRMQHSDPITLSSTDMGGAIDIQHPKRYSLLIAYEEDERMIQDFRMKKDIVGLLNYLNRGYQFVEGIDGQKPEHLEH